MKVIKVLALLLSTLILSACFPLQGFKGWENRFAGGASSEDLLEFLDSNGFHIERVSSKAFLVQRIENDPQPGWRINQVLKYECDAENCKYGYAARSDRYFGNSLFHTYFVYWAEINGDIVAFRAQSFLWEWFRK